MKKVQFVFLIGFFCFVEAVFANDWIFLNKAKVKFLLPKGWVAQKDLMGIPLVIYSPIKINGRVTISITPTGIDDINLDKKILSDNWKDYKNGRLNWLEKVNGVSQEIFPYRNEDWGQLKNIHHVGHRYYLGDVHYTEHSYYVECDKQIFHIKSLYRYEEFQKDEKSIESVIKTFQCESMLGAKQ
ncbi:MAG: hypothetical protein Fur0010_08380 [Bdellovibrio sp.]